jgi:hypothetical protein
MPDVTFLGGFVAAQQQQVDHGGTASEIHPIAGTLVNPHLGNIFANRLAVAIIAFYRAIKTQSNLGFSDMVFQADQPGIKFIGFLKDVHGHSVFIRIQKSSEL